MTTRAPAVPKSDTILPRPNFTKPISKPFSGDTKLSERYDLILKNTEDKTIQQLVIDLFKIVTGLGGGSITEGHHLLVKIAPRKGNDANARYPKHEALVT